MTCVHFFTNQEPYLVHRTCKLQARGIEQHAVSPVRCSFHYTLEHHLQCLHTESKVPLGGLVQSACPRPIADNRGRGRREMAAEAVSCCWLFWSPWCKLLQWLLHGLTCPSSCMLPELGHTSNHCHPERKPGPSFLVSDWKLIEPSGNQGRVPGKQGVRSGEVTALTVILTDRLDRWGLGRAHLRG